jgi:hypothetical protein
MTTKRSAASHRRARLWRYVVCHAALPAARHSRANARLVLYAEVHPVPVTRRWSSPTTAWAG